MSRLPAEIRLPSRALLSVKRVLPWRTFLLVLLVERRLLCRSLLLAKKVIPWRPLLSRLLAGIRVIVKKKRIIMAVANLKKINRTCLCYDNLTRALVCMSIEFN